MGIPDMIPWANRRTLNGNRASRTTANGGFTKTIPIENANQEIIGYKMLLNYFLAKDNMTNWLMYEYMTSSGSQKMDEFVLCKVYAKKKNEEKLQLIQ
ncbi:NAC domain-containing protein 68 [Morus notabilis]|uniref:NAC domain-containing protein 68 n=1 Tax=Morus notabilis TaxID=981085 RepID=W9REI2_9ROSA|nr:NAC domain-containing protein 68 [Morus notabilis]